MLILKTIILFKTFDVNNISGINSDKLIVKLIWLKA